MPYPSGRLDLQAATPGPLTLKKAAAVLTSAYTGFVSTSIDLTGYNCVVSYVAVDTQQSSTVGSVKFQWSWDNTTFFDEEVDGTPSTSGTEATYQPYSKVITVDLSSSGIGYDYRRFDRKGNFFRVVAKSSGTTTGKLAVYLAGIHNSG